MASKASLNQIAVVAVAQGVADMIIDNYGMCIDLSVYNCAEAVREAAQDALRVLGISTLTPKDDRRVKTLIESFQTHIKDRHARIATITSLAVGLVDESVHQTKNTQKFYSMMGVFAEICTLHEIFDPNYRYLGSYSDADELTKKWHETLEAA